MNILVLPLYKRADAIQEEENAIEKKLEKGVAHIKKTFSGDERFMMLQTYYRQNNYKPSFVLKGLLPLALEIPFFMAAYSFLSNLTCLKNNSFLLISNLGEADGLMFGVNLLPILMTAVNIVSSSIYSKDAPLKSRIQLYLMAAVFLVLLYDSPSALVLYWTLNNVFSLVKNIINKSDNSDFIVKILVSLFGAVLLAGSFLLELSKLKTVALIMVGILAQIPLVLLLLKKKPSIEFEFRFDSLTFVFSAVYIALITGLYIPLMVIKSSAGEFVDFSTAESPLKYIFSSMKYSVGFFVVWLGIYYLLSNDKVKGFMSYLTLCLSFIFTADFALFTNSFGNMSNKLVYDIAPSVLNMSKLLNLVFVLIVFVVIYLVRKYSSKLSKPLLCTLSLMIVVTSVVTVKGIKPEIEAEIRSINSSKEHGTVNATLSDSGKNVVVIMLDRAISSFIPYIFNEIPELYQMYEGFTYYPNTVAYGDSTNISSPSLFGGYEYTPEEINRRTDKTLKEKQNEADKVLPVLFDEGGYKVTVCNPPYANYDEVPDLSIYDEYPDISAYNTNNGELLYFEGSNLSSLERNLFCYSLFRVAPSILSGTLYDDGNYHSLSSDGSSESSRGVIFEYSISNPEFANNYVVLDKLSDIFTVEKSTEDTYLSLVNETTHYPAILNSEDYMPGLNLADYAADENNLYKYSIDGNEIYLETEEQYTHYQINACSLILVGEWLDYLKENNAYDNTRIIICSDHGKDIGLFNLGMDGVDAQSDVSGYNALLLYKDFNSSEFTTDESFMTLADIPFMLTEDLVDTVNPFTGNSLDQTDKKKDVQYILDSPRNTGVNKGNAFVENGWYALFGNVSDIDSWKKTDSPID